PALSPDEKFLATAGSRTITIWDLQTGRAVHTIRAEVAPVSQAGASVLAFSPDGKRLAYLTGGISAAYIVDLDSQTVIGSFGSGRSKPEPSDALPLPGQPSVEEFLGLCFTVGGRELRAFSTDRVVTWNVETGRQLRAFEL